MANRLSGYLAVGLSLGFAACGGDSLTLPPTAGTLEITTSTAGAPSDADGYTLQVDARQPQTIGPAATLQVQELAPGAHNVLLTGIAANCSVSGENPRTVNIVAGETTTSTFELTCGATTGALEITSQTSGDSPDADGYTVSLDGTESGAIGANATVTLGNLPAKSYVVGLTGVSANCHVEGDNLRAVTVTPGATATVTFAVTCEALPPEVGTLRITTTTGGPSQDTGYEFAVDGGQTQPIGPNTSATVANISVGNHTVVLSDVATNCTVNDGASKDVIITAGATATLNFNITCSLLPPTVGSIHVTTATTGLNQDPNGYAVRVDGGAIQAIGVTGEVSFANITAGSHTVHLLDVAANCAEDADSKDVTVVAGATVDVGFAITCSAIPPSASKSTVSVDPNNFPAGTGSSTITVTVKDAGGKRLAGVAVTATSSGTGNQFTGTPATTDANGVATFSFSSTVAEIKTITVTAGGVVLGDTEDITVRPLTTTAAITSVTPEPSTAGVSFTVTFTVAGEFGTTPTGGTVTVFSQQESGTVGCVDVPVSQGSCAMTLNTITTHSLQAVYSGDSQFEGDTSDPVNHVVQ